MRAQRYEAEQVVSGVETHLDVVIVGAGAAGLMCAHTAGYRGRSVLVLDHANKAGKKILMSGGGRCNFTNMNTSPANFIAANPHFCKSALKRYTPAMFLELVERHGVDWCEKAPGQLFCQHSSKDILQLLLTECEWAGVDVRLDTAVDDIRRQDGFWQLTAAGQTVRCQSLVIATGGLSIPTLGASPFGYRVAEQFGLRVLPVRAALVPFTLHPEDKQWLAPLAGVSCDVAVSCNGMTFEEPLLITHRGLSGPALLQISTYWQPGDQLCINLLPEVADLPAALLDERRQRPAGLPLAWLSGHLPKRLASALVERHGWHKPFQEMSKAALEGMAQALQAWTLVPAGTEGYRTAEVTLGGIDTDAISSRTFEAKEVPGLFFIGEVLDVTGQLGGHNFQWAWASGFCAGQVV